MDGRYTPDIQGMASATECTGIAPAFIPRRRMSGGTRARLKRRAGAGR